MHVCKVSAEWGRSLWQAWLEMVWAECKLAEARCRRRRLRPMVMKLPCSLWFLLLFGAGGMVLFTHLQDLSETFQQQAPGVKLRFAGQSRRKDLCATEAADSGPSLEGKSAAQGPSSPIPPMQFPAFEWTWQPATSGSRGQEVNPARVTKSHRKLLLKSNPVGQTHNSSSSTSPSSSSSLRDGWRRLARVQQDRKQLMKEVCAKYKSQSTRTVTPQHVSRIFVEDRHKLLYCEVPKVGCSNWKRVLMVLGGSAASTQEIPHEAVHYGNHLKRLDSFDRRGIARRLDTYTKVLFVREPFERLVSAFRDKFESPNTYYHPVFGRPIISRYRANASQAALRTGTGVTFKEFMQYLLDVHRPVGMDIHWEHVNQLCSPCLLRYDFIGRFETMEEDANFLLRRAGAPSNLTFPVFKDRNPHAERTSARITQRYFAQLNASERQRAYDFYYMDYLMFNYSKPFKDLY
ncbi:carbohydrate sulfotransferase 8-like isoform X1 [Scleropages formosus]|uniref:Carbohydrate sulfotransferase n=1 Tax=Scleropages formosus TaxID=113540 RepID=A0A8C9UXM0_SCLFO|nr:carbohydrate sulfotransferase 8-like isoform X1 [Scleropages formosus]